MDRMSWYELQSNAIAYQSYTHFPFSKISLKNVQITFTSDRPFHVNKQITGIT